MATTPFNSSLADQLSKLAPEMKLTCPVQSKPLCMCHTKPLSRCPTEMEKAKQTKQ